MLDCSDSLSVTVCVCHELVLQGESLSVPKLMRELAGPQTIANGHSYLSFFGGGTKDQKLSI